LRTETPNPRTNRLYPYLLDIQSNLLSDLRTTLAIPLAAMSGHGQTQIDKLNPLVSIQGEHYLVMTQQLSGISRKALGEKVTDLVRHRDAVIDALDFAVMGI